MNYKNIFGKNSFLLTVTISAVFLFSSCNTDDDLGEYYEGTFNDSVIIFSESDTIDIVLEQSGTQFHKENIPYSIETNNNADTITLKLFVSFGSYEQNPKPVKNISEISDTFYVWYSLRDKMGKVLNKNNSITEANTSPAINYVSIDSVAVQKGTNKVINFISRLIQ
jgi:hypothetical protein